MAIMRMGTVVINTTSPADLAPFWRAVLGVEVDRSVGDFFIWLKPQPGSGVALAFQQVEHPTPHPNRLHIDSGVADLAEATSQIEALGGSQVAEHEMHGFRWHVMADPDGNEFCIAQV